MFKQNPPKHCHVKMSQITITFIKWFYFVKISSFLSTFPSFLLIFLSFHFSFNSNSPFFSYSIYPVFSHSTTPSLHFISFPSHVKIYWWRIKILVFHHISYRYITNRSAQMARRQISLLSICQIYKENPGPDHFIYMKIIRTIMITTTYASTMSHWDLNLHNDEGLC